MAKETNIKSRVLYVSLGFLAVGTYLAYKNKDKDKTSFHIPTVLTTIGILGVCLSLFSDKLVMGKDK
jgi:hypothetical protein